MNIELFSCSGGMAEGFRRAGIAFDCAFDASPDACDSYEANLGHRPVQMDVRDLVRLARGGWRPEGGVRLLVADPPCTPWSRAGKRLGTEDARDMLEETAELIALLRPRAYLIGNVPGLDDNVNLPTVQRVIGGLGRHGYCTADYVRLDAADFGVPQHRVRPFWFGHLDGPCVRWPHPTHGDPADVLIPRLPGIESPRPWVTCRDALGHLSIAELGRPVRVRNKTSMHPCSQVERPDSSALLLDGNRPPGNPDAPSRTITGTGGRSGQVKVRPWTNAHPTSKVDAPANTITREGGRAGKRATVLEVVARPHHDVNGPDRPARTITTTQDDGRFLEWPWDCPATTILTGNADGRLAPPGKGSLFVGDRAENAVILSERAAAILQGFPDNWKFLSRAKTGRWSQLGQAMPPPLAHAVAVSVKQQMEAADSAP